MTPANIPKWFALLILAALAPLAHGAKTDEGKAIAFDPRKGNCTACHLIAGAEVSGDIGPPLANMKGKYPKEEQLRPLIWDYSQTKPDTVMPPYGRHRILTEDEIDALTDFIHTL